MCGIVGQYCYDGTQPDANFLTAMIDRIAHRGPDGRGMFLKGRIGLAHCRLAIIDLSDDASQPIANEDGTIWLVYNGEIYNYIELRQELVKKGHKFLSKTDSEVIVHAYEEWGATCLERFNGMWAFALWDDKKQQLFCARDRFGIKPFYYTEIEGSFIFASEIKALLEHPDVGKNPDNEMLCSYLTWGVHDHTNRTMFSGIFQLRPAHAMVVTVKGQPPQVRYWDAKVNPLFTSNIQNSDISLNLFNLLKDAVRIHLRSDVAVGTCLSGGIDSSTIVSLINDLIQNDSPESIGARQKTFSAVFDDKRFDESRYINELVNGTSVDAYRTQPDPQQVLKHLHQLLYIQDEPFGSLSIYAQYRVMQLASKRVKVVLDGQGADELLAGYLAYQSCSIRGLIRSFHLFTALREIIGAFRYHRSFFFDSLYQLLIRAKRRHLLRVLCPNLNRYNGALDQVLYRELMITNLPALLHYEDRNSMAFSIESRVPYLDVQFGRISYILTTRSENKTWCN